jgi:hypothetical protein
MNKTTKYGFIRKLHKKTQEILLMILVLLKLIKLLIEILKQF